MTNQQSVSLQRRPPATESGVGPTLGYGYAELNAEPPEKGQLADYLRALYERRWIAIGVFLALVTAVNVNSFTTAPQYEAEARLLIEPEAPWVRTFDGIVTPDDAQEDYYQTHYDLLQSRALVKRTLDELELWDHPELSGGDRDDSFDLGRALRHAVARVGFFPTWLARRTESAAPLVRVLALSTFGISVSPIVQTYCHRPESARHQFTRAGFRRA